MCQISSIYDLVLFADDPNLLFSHIDFPTLMNLINSEKLKISDWFKANKLSLNTQKSNYITFKPRQAEKRRDKFTLNIEMNGLKMNQIKEIFFWCYFIWVIVMDTPYFSGCEENLKVWTLFVNRLFVLLSQLCTCTLYYSLVFSYLPYCILVWGSTYSTHVYNTRSSNRFHIPLCRTNVRKFSVFFDKLSACIRHAPSLYSFQSRVKNFFLSCYWIHNLTQSLFSSFIWRTTPRISFYLFLCDWGARAS